jgi:hypothetical protein
MIIMCFGVIYGFFWVRTVVRRAWGFKVFEFGSVRNKTSGDFFWLSLLK